MQVNTIRADFISQGMNHAEGGWPKVREYKEQSEYLLHHPSGYQPC
jgi:hypothetical protein